MTRVTCLVPLCRRTRRPSPEDAARIAAGARYEWICSKHWSAVPRQLRRTLYRARRLGRGQLEEMVWRRCRAAAIDRAFP